MASNLHQRLEGFCTICWESDDFRALECGHCFCLKCLHTLYELHRKIECPMDRKEINASPSNLPTPQEFRGTLFVQTITDEDSVGDINGLLDDMVKRRKITIKQLRAVANELESHEFNCASAKVGGSVAGVLGATMGIAGLGLSSTGIGSVVGVPLSLAGMGLATAGGLTSGGAIVVESLLKKQGMENVQNDLNQDYFRAQQIKILLSRASVDSNLAKRWKFRGFDIVHLGGLIARTAKLGLTASAGVRTMAQAAAMGMGRATATTGLHITGLVFAAALIPLDIWQMIVSSIRIHKNKPSKVIQDVISVSDRLEKEMKIFLIDGGYLHLVHTSDSKWCYIAVFATKKKQFEEINQCEMTLDEIREFGDIIEEGDGAVIPDEKLSQIHENWNQFYHEYLANNK